MNIPEPIVPPTKKAVASNRFMTGRSPGFSGFAFPCPGSETESPSPLSDALSLPSLRSSCSESLTSGDAMSFGISAISILCVGFSSSI